MTDTVVRWAVVLLAIIALSQSLSAKASGAATPRSMIERVAGKPVRVDCKGKIELDHVKDMSVLGVAFIEQSEVWLHVDICRILKSSDDAWEIGVALYVVAHEAAHITGIWDESVASCWGLELARVLAWEFYGYGYNTKQSRLVEKGARYLHSFEPAQYHRFC